MQRAHVDGGGAMKGPQSTRRAMWRRALCGAGGIGLRSLATGIPASVLLNPLRAHAATPPARALVLVTSAAGDPIGANVPGTYGAGKEGIVHPESPDLV